MEKTITITIKKSNWRKLRRLEDKADLRTHDQAIEFLFKEIKSIAKKVNSNE